MGHGPRLHATRGRPRRVQSMCRGTARSGSSAAKPQQGVHRKLPQPMVHLLDTVESPNSKR
jgi:hypothetical protein